MPLEVGRLEVGERELLAEGGDQVLEVGPGGLERRRLVGALVGGQVAVAERCQGRVPGNKRRDVSAPGGGLAVEPDELGDVDAGRQLDEPLVEAEEQVLDLGNLRVGLLGGDLADRDEVLLAVVPEDHPVRAVTLLEAGHGSPQCDRNAVAKLLPSAPRAQQ